ncbi:hypothetical protein HYY69_03995 [Candidatus Woesearchaeota archaeon]|nr:hypothetical protein [Candidatus Woesearchaeota archaeon]
MQKQEIIATIDDCFNEDTLTRLLTHNVSPLVSESERKVYGQLVFQAYVRGMMDGIYQHIKGPDPFEIEFISIMMSLGTPELPINEVVPNMSHAHKLGFDIGSLLYHWVAVRYYAEQRVVFAEQQKVPREKTVYDHTVECLSITKIAHDFGVHQYGLVKRVFETCFGSITDTFLPAKAKTVQSYFPQTI